MNTSVPVRGLVLAGGRSRRMGSDKAALELAGETLLQRAVGLLEGHLDEVFVSIRADQSDDTLRSQYACIQDDLADHGPAAGILSAHMQLPDSAWLVIACDMPMLNSESLEALLSSRDDDCEAVAWSAADGSGPEPLCALYEPATLAAFREHVQQGGNTSPRAWLAQRRIILLGPDNEDRLAGVNTQEEVKDLFDRLATQHRANRNK